MAISACTITPHDLARTSLRQCRCPVDDLRVTMCYHLHPQCDVHVSSKRHHSLPNTFWREKKPALATKDVLPTTGWHTE